MQVAGLPKEIDMAAIRTSSRFSLGLGTALALSCVPILGCDPDERAMLAEKLADIQHTAECDLDNEHSHQNVQDNVPNASPTLSEDGEIQLAAAFKPRFQDGVYIHLDEHLTGTAFENLRLKLEANGHEVSYNEHNSVLDALSPPANRYSFRTMILGNPSAAITAQEVVAVRRFVEAGGRVLLLTNPLLETSENNLQALTDAYELHLGDRVGDTSSCYMTPDHPFVDADESVATNVSHLIFTHSRVIESGPDRMQVLARVQGSDFATVVAIRSDNGGELIYMPNSLSAGDDTERRPSEAIHGLHLADNCQFVMNLIDGGACVDETPPQTGRLDVFSHLGNAHVDGGEPLHVRFNAPNGSFRIYGTFEDVSGIWSASFRLNGGEEISLLPEVTCEPYLESYRAPKPTRDVRTDLLFLRDLHAGDNTVELFVSDGHGNTKTENITITKNIFTNFPSGRISIGGHVDDQEGLAAWEHAYDLPAGMTNVMLNSETGECVENTSSHAHYAIATRDMVDPNFVAGAHGHEIVAGFSNLAQVTNNDVSGLTLHFGVMNLDDVIRGVDYSFAGNVEYRTYSNPGTSLVQLRYHGETILTGTMPTIHVTLDHNNPDLCSDDSFLAKTEVVADLHIAHGVSGPGRVVAAAFLSDVGNEGVCFQLADDESIIRTEDSFNIENAVIDAGGCE